MGAFPKFPHISCILGDVSSVFIKQCLNDILNISASYYPFQCEVEHLGMFRKQKSPRIIWAGVKDNKPLLDLQDEVSKCFREGGIALKESPYTAHITLGSLRSARKRDLLVDAISMDSSNSFGTLNVVRIVIMESIPINLGVAYQVFEYNSFGQGHASACQSL